MLWVNCAVLCFNYTTAICVNLTLLVVACCCIYYHVLVYLVCDCVLVLVHISLWIWVFTMMMVHCFMQGSTKSQVLRIFRIIAYHNFQHFYIEHPYKLYQTTFTFTSIKKLISINLYSVPHRELWNLLVFFC